MPDATRQLDRTPDVTPGNQDAPGQMNQPPATTGLGAGTVPPGAVVESTEPPLGGDPWYEDLEGFRPGQHPEDPTAPSQFPGDSPTPLDTAELVPAPKGHKQFDTENGDAIAVYQRAAHDWDSGAITLGSGTAGPVMVVGRQRGRLATTLWVPAKDANGNVPNGVIIASTQGEIQGAGYPIVLNVGDSLTINSEGAVFASVIAGNTTGLVFFKTEYNPAGGELGNW
jgi:hypothetical protein